MPLKYYQKEPLGTTAMMCYLLFMGFHCELEPSVYLQFKFNSASSVIIWFTLHLQKAVEFIPRLTNQQKLWKYNKA